MRKEREGSFVIAGRIEKNMQNVNIFDGREKKEENDNKNQWEKSYQKFGPVSISKLC